MGEENQGNSGTRPEPLDLRTFRTIQRTEPMSPESLKKAFNDDVKESIGNDGKIDTEMFERVEQYLEVVGEPYSAKYFKAEEILNDLTREDFELIDEHILKQLKDKKQITSFEAFDKTMEELETLLGLDKSNETMHRILKTVKFIKAGQDGSKRF